MHLHTLISKDVFPGHATRGTPFRLMVAHDNIIRYGQFLQAVLYFLHGFLISIIGEVSCDQDKVYTVQSVYPADALLQISLVRGSLGVEMQVCQLYKTKVLGSNRAAQHQKNQEEIPSHFFHIYLYAKRLFGAVSPVVHREMMSEASVGLSAHLRSSAHSFWFSPSTLRGTAISITFPSTA